MTFDLWLTLIWDSRELEEYRRLRRLANFLRFTNRIQRSEVSRARASDTKFTIIEVRLAMERMQKKLKNLHEKGFDVHPNDRGKMLFDFMGLKFPAGTSEEICKRAGKILSNSGYSSGFPNINPEARPTMKLLKQTFPDLKVALISNAARSARAYGMILKTLGVGEFFDHLVISCEVGYLKPRKEIFEKALSLLSVKPSEALHIGDLFQTDILGATSCGMNACLYTGLWDKYAQYRNPGMRIPPDFRPSKKAVVAEIGRLQDCVEVAQEIS